MRVAPNLHGVATEPEPTAARPSCARKGLRTRWWMVAVRLFVCAGVVATGANTWAQGGPPMVTDDPGTPGDGHWEINLGAIGTRTPGHWEIAAPDADINYGWGVRVQLKVDVPWLTTRDDGQHWK